MIKININININIKTGVGKMTVKELRAKTGMTQKAFSEYFGISKRTVEQWEGEKRVCADYLFELMKYKLEKEGLIEE